MNPLNPVFRRLDRLFDPVNPLIGWYLRRMGPILSVFLVAYVFVMLTAPIYVPLLPEDIHSSHGAMTMERFSRVFIWGNIPFGFFAVVAAAGVINQQERIRTDEMLRLDGLTPAERCYGEMVPMLAIGGLMVAVLLPCFVVIALFGASLKLLCVSLLLPMLVAIDIALLSFAFQWTRPKRKRYPGRWWHWLGRVILWDVIQVFFIGWTVVMMSALCLFSPVFQPVEQRFVAWSPYFVLVFAVFGAAEFCLLRRQISRNLDEPRAALLLNLAFYVPMLLFFFPAAWLPIVLLSW